MEREQIIKMNSLMDKSSNKDLLKALIFIQYGKIDKKSKEALIRVLEGFEKTDKLLEGIRK